MHRHVQRWAALSLAALLSLTVLLVIQSPAQGAQTEWVLEDVVNKNTSPVQSLTLDGSGSPHIFVRPGQSPAPGNLTHFYRQDGVWYNETVTELWDLASIDSAMDALGNLHVVFNGKLADDSVHLFYATNAGMPPGQWNVTVLSGNYLYTGAKMASGPGNGVTFCTWDGYVTQTTWFIHATYGQPFTFENVSASLARYAPLDLCYSSDGTLHELFNDYDSYLSEAFKNETGWHKRLVDPVNRTEMGAMSIDQNDRLHVVYICANRLSYNELIVQYVSGDSNGWGTPLNLVSQSSGGYGWADIDSRGDSRVALKYESADGIHQLNLDHGVVTSSSVLYRSYAVVKLDANYDVKMAVRRGVGPEIYVQYAYQREITIPGPTGWLSAENNLANGNANLTWLSPLSDGNDSIIGYNVYRGTSSGGEGAIPIARIGNVTSYTDTTTVLGQTYWYQVSANNSVGEGGKSNEAYVLTGKPPSAPTLYFEGLTDVGIYIDWSEPINDGGLPVTNYMILRGDSSGGETWLNTIYNVTYYIDTGLTHGNFYYYQVRAINGFGRGAVSNEVVGQSIWMPSAPMHLTAVRGYGIITLTWTAPADDGGLPILGYKILRGTNTSDMVEIGTSLTTEYVDTDITAGKTYAYGVGASNLFGDGERITVSDIVAPEGFYHITGKVTDSSGIPIYLATVSLENGSSVQTNQQGNFSILASLGNHTLTITASQRETHTVKVVVGDADLDIGTVEMVNTPMDPLVWYGAIAVAIVIIIGLVLFMILGGRKQKREEEEKKQQEKKP